MTDRSEGGPRHVPIRDPAVLPDYVSQQKSHPAPFEVRRGRPVYQSRPDFGRLRKGIGFVKLTDFGLAVRGDVQAMHNHDIQPLAYTAPEVMLKAGWTYSADIWNLGLLVSPDLLPCYCPITNPWIAVGAALRGQPPEWKAAEQPQLFLPHSIRSDDSSFRASSARASCTC